MNQVIKLFILAAFLFASVSACVHGSKRDILDSYEKELLENYRQPKSGDHSAKNNILDYISTRLTFQSHLGDIDHVAAMISLLKKSDQKIFEDQMIQLSVYLIDGPSVENIPVSRMEKGLQIEYTPRFTASVILHKLSFLRTDKSMQYIESLIYPVEQWREPEFSSLINQYKNSENDEARKMMQHAIHDLRLKAMGCIFHPLDSVGKTKLSQIEKIVKSFDDDSPSTIYKTKALLLQRLDIWKKIYSGEIDVTRWRD